MTLTIHLTPEQEERLSAEAGRLGEDTSALVHRILAWWLRGEDRDRLSPALPVEIERRVRMQSILSQARANANQAEAFTEEMENQVRAACDEARTEQFQQFRDAEHGG